MPTSRSPRVLNVNDLLDRPGVSRPLAADFDLPEGLTLPLVDVTDPLRLEAVLESVVEGILVRGTVSANLEVSCARCLSPVRDQLRPEVAELFSDPAGADDPEDIDPGYKIVEGRIDLDTLLRDALAPAVPLAPRCRPDCKGLCPTCGVNRNTTDCDCVEDIRDPRWAALEGVRVDDEGALRRPAAN
ncbi:MAG: DUF177 domain-containing protein [Nitriliruptorales bacterium]|nr:DUF177 domain-containing protein [Nitriliruptorales bacterium]